MTAEIIEGNEERGLALRPRASTVETAGTTALAEMSDVEFEARLGQIKKGRDRIDRIHRELMREGVDYGVIPGTKNPTLLKPGAEILCQAYKLVPEFVLDHQYGDGTTRPDLRVISRCFLHLGALDGPVVGDGNGAANTWEPRYRYRQGERTCPKCGSVGTVIKGKDEYGGGWLCLTPDTPILYSDMTWRPIGQAVPGDEIVGFDEYPVAGSQRRKLRTSRIEALWWSRKPTIRVVTDSGDLTTTAEHRWLEHHAVPGYRGHWGDPWSETQALRVGNPLRFIGMTDRPAESGDYRRGYLAGMTESDGTMRVAPGVVPYWRVALQERDETVLGRLVAYLSSFGVEAWTRPFRGSEDPRHSPMRKVEVRALARVTAIHALIQPMESEDYRRGYLAGFFDGDGSGSEGRITLYNTNEAKLDRLAAYGQALGFVLAHADDGALRLHGGVRETMRFASVVGPALLRKVPIYGVSMQYDPAVIEAIESGPTTDVVDIQTSTGTYFAAGHASHNCYRKKGGCGAKFDDGDPAIEAQEVGQVENPDPYGLDVTIVKMAEKRSHVDATLRALAISGLFTQDVEDLDESRRGESRLTRQSPPRRAETRHVSLTGRVVVEDGDFVPRQYPQGWAILFHLAVQGRDEPARIIVTRPTEDALPHFDEGATVRVEGEWQARQNAVVAASVTPVETAGDIDVLGGYDPDEGSR